MPSVNQSPTVLLHHASELIQDVLEDRLLDNESLLSAWVERATVWSKDYGAYINRENGDMEEKRLLPPVGSIGGRSI